MALRNETKRLSSKGVLWLAGVAMLAALPAGAGLGTTARVGQEGPVAWVADGPSSRIGTSVGPDVTVLDLTDIDNYGAVGGIRAYAVGTNSCNVGTEPVDWCDNGGGCGQGTTDSDHPVIAQNVYRLKSGRFEQIGMSWLKHGFLSRNDSDPRCGPNCIQPPLGGSQLGVGCTDIYSAGLNGDQPLGMRSEVNAATGEFPFPYTEVSSPQIIDQRIQVLETDVNPALNPGALYWVEGQYIAPDDAVAENALNNASYNEVTVSGGNFNLNLTGGTVTQKSSLYAWQVEDAAVEIANTDVPGSVPVERFEAARRVTQDGNTFHYEIVVRNMNSDRDARAFTVTFPDATTIITNPAFHDVDHHSGEFDPDSGLPYLTTDWTVAVDANSVRWETDPFDTTPNANALRWATMFSFRFDADFSPLDVVWELELFKPGSPTTVDIPFPDAGPPCCFADDFETGDTSRWDLTVN